MSTGYRIVAATGLDQGDRPYQQDQVRLLTHPRDEGVLLGVLADGMGGRSGGRKAADQVLMTAQQLFERFHADTDSPTAFLTQVAREAHIVIRLIAVSAEQEPHSTVAAFILNADGTCHWAHSGDSRLYHFRNDRLVFRTRDHSYVQTLVERGELTDDRAQSDPRANILLSCLGAEREPLIAVHSTGPLGPGDALLVCSDGLWHYFTETELSHVLDQLSPREACEFLIQQARKRAAGHGDNLSLIVVKFEALGKKAKG
jgi:serine/threonine protein phosphatase PrpC